MSGAFAAHQLLYAAHGIPTYPLGSDKTPAIRGYSNVGLRGSQQLVNKFAEANAFAFNAGPSSGVTVIDIDTHDAALVSEMQGLYGPSPLHVATPSGGHHLYYRYGGESRRIRQHPSVDILGAGTVVAAGSITSSGRYTVVHGDFSSLALLAPIRHKDRPAASDRVPKGRRNNSLFGYCHSIVGHCDSQDDLVDAARGWADRALASPLPDAEIVKTCASVWKYREGRRRIMGHVIDAGRFAALAKDRSALALFAFLSAMNGQDSSFMVADGLATKLGWPRRSVPGARKVLLELGLIRQVRAPSKGAAAIYRWNL